MKKVILSLNGGGVRGYMSSMLLKTIESGLRIQLKDKHASLIDYVDVVAGTSTGAIQACLLTYEKPDGSLKFDCEDLERFYDTFMYNIFNGSKKPFNPLRFVSTLNVINAKNKKKYVKALNKSAKYDPSTLSGYMEAYLTDKKLKDIKKHLIIPVVNVETGKAEFLSNVKSRNEVKTIRLRDAAMASSAATTFFPPHKGYIDGGFACNNPSVAAVAKLRKYENISVDDIVVINIGTGAEKANEADNLIDMMLINQNGVAKYESEQLVRNYFNLDILDDFKFYSNDIADASKENVRNMRKAGVCSIKAQMDKIYDIVNTIIDTKE